MIVYCVASKGSDHAMGSNIEYLHITPTGPYHTGSFPPVFTSKKRAEEYLENHSVYKGVVVELVMDGDQEKT